MTGWLFRMFTAWIAVAAGGLACAHMARGPARRDVLHLRKVVILMRHGVRAPTQSPQKLSRWSDRKWPSWSAPPGDLTRNGFRLAEMMAVGIRQYYGSRGLVVPAGCAGHRDLYVYADNMQRTIATGQAVLKGFLGDCHVVPSHFAIGKDPLFHAIKMNACRVDKGKARRKMMRDLQRMTDMRSFQNHMEDMRRILCSSEDTKQAICALRRPTRIVVGEHVALHGGLHVASAVGEAFLMEYADGKPLKDVGWGHLRSVHAVNRMLYLHNVYSAITRQESYVAAHGATPLMRAINNVLMSGQLTEGRHAIPQAYRRAKMVFLIGHDVNIAHVAGMLRLNWALTGQPDRTPPDMGLAFDLYRNNSGREWVGVRIFYQTLASMRAASLHKGDANPLSEPVVIKGCDSGPRRDLCTVKRFERIVSRRLVSSCSVQRSWLE